MNQQFLKDVDSGLNSNPKYLSSRYFYDEKGDKLFVEIMNMPEYYLTKAEHEILREQSSQIIDSLEVSRDTPFELIELGAGDGTKTKELLNALLKKNYQFDYLPIDISQHALDGLANSLKEELPKLSVNTKQGDYFEVLESISQSEKPKVVLFLGSNLGNMTDPEAQEFLYKLSVNLKKGDKLFLGLDLIKSKEIVLPAYNDPQKITSAFNLNLLDRINRELNAEFDTDSFQHQPEYLEEEGIARSFLVSTKTQVVNIGAINKTIEFKAGERIHTEISRKYNDEILERILLETHFSIQDKLTDSKAYFADYILERN